MALEPLEGGVLSKDLVQWKPVETCLAELKGADGKSIASTVSFGSEFAIRHERVEWRKGDREPAKTPREILAEASIEPDGGMDQDLDVSADEPWMGGTSGPSSQGFRHMHYDGWDLNRPLATFHVPMHELGESPARAQKMFDLAVACAKAGNPYWGWRFLGWSLHYVEDMGQPYHASQFASLRLLPLKTLFKGWSAFMSDATRVVGNFHLSFENYADYLLTHDPDSRAMAAFRVADANRDLVKLLSSSRTERVDAIVRALGRASNAEASAVATTQIALLGDELFSPDMDLIAGFNDASGAPKIDYAKMLQTRANSAELKAFDIEVARGFSNTAVVARWIVERFALEAPASSRILDNSR